MPVRQRAPTVLPTLSGPPLGTMAASRNLLLGAQMGIADNPAYGPALYDPIYRQVVAREKPAFLAYGSAFKFDAVCPDPPTSSGALVFTQKAYGVSNTWYVANDLTSFAQSQGCRARADAIIWNGVSTAPSWLKPLPADATNATPAYRSNLSYLVKYVSAALEQITALQAGNPGFFHAACLVNEPIVPNFANSQSPGPATFRDGPWLPPGHLVGTAPVVPDYIVKAFRYGEAYRRNWARRLKQSATTAKFFVNEALCRERSVRPRHAAGPPSLAEVDAGCEAEHPGRRPRMPSAAANVDDAFHPDWTAFGTFIEEIAALGLEVYITELDVIDYETSCFGRAGSRKTATTSSTSTTRASWRRC